MAIHVFANRSLSHRNWSAVTLQTVIKRSELQTCLNASSLEESLFVLLRKESSKMKRTGSTIMHSSSLPFHIKRIQNKSMGASVAIVKDQVPSAKSRKPSNLCEISNLRYIFPD
jgi:hypothetical protein